MEKEKKNKFFDKEIDASISRKRKILDMYSMPMPFDFSGENYLKSIWVQVS